MSQPLEPATDWRPCSSCKKAIRYGSLYWVCNVSTCNRKRTGLIFCDVSCWDAHVPMMNHRESWAEERKAPSKEEWQRTLSGEADPDKPARAARAPRVEKPGESGQPEKLEKAKSPTPVILRRSKIVLILMAGFFGFSADTAYSESVGSPCYYSAPTSPDILEGLLEKYQGQIPPAKAIIPAGDCYNGPLGP